MDGGRVDGKKGYVPVKKARGIKGVKGRHVKPPKSVKHMKHMT